MAYEAGFGGIGDGSETDLGIQASLDPRMGPVYTAYLSMLEEEGVSLIAHFTSVGQFSRYGSFALKIASDQVRVGRHFPPHAWATRDARPVRFFCVERVLSR